MRTLSPIETVDAVECVARPSAERIECRCGKCFAGGAVVSRYIGIHPYEDCYFAQRQLYCDHCNHIITWLERIEPRSIEDVLIKSVTSTPTIADFRFTGAMLSGPGYITQRKVIQRFLSNHPEARGVIG